MLLHHAFVKTAKRLSKKLAIIDRTTGRRVSYHRALIGSLILAEKFKSYDGYFIGIMVPSSAGCVLSILGALMSGKTPVMINYSTGAANNCLFAQKKCNFNTIITSKALLQKINCPVLSGMVFLEDIMENLTLLDKLFAAIKASLPLALLTKFIHSGSEDNNVVVLFTTGSEKEPKAVQLSHKNIHANLESLIPVYELNEKETFLANLPYFHVFGQTGCLWAPLYVGATIVTYANPLDFATICQIIREERCTFVGGTPSFFAGYLQKSQPDDFQSVRIFLVGADRCPDYLRKQFLAQHQKVLFEAYGATETSPGIAVNGPNSNRPGSVGKPISGVTVRIENLQTGEECRNGETGRILVKGDNVMRGYLNDPEQTSRAFHNGWYDTGDMGWLDPDGYLWIAGRLKRFVKVGGEMISLVNVEDVLLKFLPDGITCCVVEIPDEFRGAQIVAAVTQKLDDQQILKRMSEHLPKIGLPRRFVVLDELPKTATGKIDFRGVGQIVTDLLAKKKAV